jgi:predicted RNA-binding Zn-ribbon protein involved in translation (DUF1610 family)
MANSTHKVMVAECPECETNIRVHRALKVGQIFICPVCDERLVVRQPGRRYPGRAIKSGAPWRWRGV